MDFLKRSTKFSFNEPDHPCPLVLFIEVHPARDSRPNRVIHPLLYKMIDKWTGLGHIIYSFKVCMSGAMMQASHFPLLFRDGPTTTEILGWSPQNLHGKTPTIPFRYCQGVQTSDGMLPIRSREKLVTPSVIKSMSASMWSPKKKASFFHTTSCADLKSTLDRILQNLCSFGQSKASLCGLSPSKTIENSLRAVHQSSHSVSCNQPLEGSWTSISWQRKN